MRRSRIAALLVALALVFIGIGVWRGEAVEVLVKSINICLECIGIG